MRNSICLLSTLMFSIPVFAIDDYRCTEKSLCEIQDYTEVSSVDEAFSQGKFEGKIRLAYIDQNNHELGASDTYGTSIGGQMKYETAKLYNVSLAASAFISQKVSPLSGDVNKGELNPDFFDAQGDAFVYLGEAYIDYSYKNIALRYGRQKLDTPLNDRDDIRMLPNTFEALTLGYGGIEHFVFMAGYISAWAGYDSGDDISKFKDIPGEVSATGEIGEGVALAGVMNDSIEGVDLQAWYYDFNKLAGVVYADAVYAAEYSGGLGVEFGVQYGNYAEKSSSGVDGDAYGGVLALSYDILTLGSAVNEAKSSGGKSVILGYGGGPYFTSMEEMTIDSINDAQAYVLSAELDLSNLLLDSMALFYAYGHFEGNDSGSDTEYIEQDIILSYGINERADLELSYAYVDDRVNSGAGDTGYDRFLARANYSF